MNEEVAPQEPVRPVWTLRLEEDEIRSLTATWTDRQQRFADVVKVKPACIHFIRDFRVWPPNLAAAAVGAPGLLEDPVLAHRVYVTSDILGAEKNVPLQSDDGDLEGMDQRTASRPRRKRGC